ncbi:hypothetical protein E2320_020454 [Naja naja]|nr:hypothetical protein E2320_020454 [Naja naja]
MAVSLAAAGTLHLIGERAERDTPEGVTSSGKRKLLLCGCPEVGCQSWFFQSSDRIQPLESGKHLKGLHRATCNLYPNQEGYDLKEKKNLFGQKKDYWDFLSGNLMRLNSNPHAGVQHVTSLVKGKTQRGEWYYARSPFLDEKLRTDILSSLYELDGIAFHLALRREDLDATWPRVSEVLPQFSTRALEYTHSEEGLSKVGNSNQEHGLHQGSTFMHRSTLRTMDVPDSRVDDKLRVGPEQPLEKWIGVWRSRKNSLLQMGSLLKLNPFMERYVQSPPSDKEQKKANGELQVRLEKEQPGNVSSFQGLCYPQPKHCLEGDSLQKQECLRTLIGEMSVLQQKLALQQEENISEANSF